MRSLKSKLSAVLAFTVVGITACGDSSGPSNLDAAAALKSLALGLQQLGSNGSTASLNANASFNAIAPYLNQVTVNINGSSQTMFGLALHETFPLGTCQETIFGNVIPAEPGACTPPPLGLVVLLWQSHSASERPDRMAMFAADVGTSTFDFNLESPTLPAVGIYAEGEDKVWFSLSGSLTSAVAGTSQTCNIPLPPYAKSGVCQIATFDEQGSVAFEPVEFNNGTYDVSTSVETKTLTIPRQTLHGLWLAISEVQPIGLTASQVVPSALLQRMLAR